jgi:uncharacterized RDD family membrane protein YckC
LDKLTIDTPEQVHLEFTLAGLGSRFMAIFLDTLIQFLAFLAIFVISLGFSASGLFERKQPAWVTAIFILLGFCLYWGYYATFETFWKGQTPGKRWAGIRVIKETGRPINAFEAIARNLMRPVDWFPALYGVGVVAMLLNKNHRRLGDYVAGTLVVHETSGREPQVYFNTPAQSEFAIPQAAQLTLQEAELIETFLARRLDIPSDVRLQNGRRIAEMITARLAIDPMARPANDEQFLELMVREFRNRAQYR